MDPERREVLEAAFEEVEKVEVEAAAPAPEPVAEAPVEKVAAPEPTPEKVEAEAAERAAAPEKPAAPVADDKPLDEKPAAPVEILKAPASWSPAEREEWSKIPPALQKTIHKRELEITQTLGRTARERAVAQEYLDTVKPYEHLIQAQNSTPKQAITNMMETARVLTTGTPQQKASMVAQVIANFGVDIVELDSILVNKPPPQRQPQAELPPHILQQLQPVLSLAQRAQQFEQERAARITEDSKKAVAAISEREFFEDLREDMADMMELSAKRGTKLTLEEAYDRAAAVHPEISKIVQQRSKATEVSAAASTLARARRASSTVSGAPASGGTVIKPDNSDRRAVIARAMDGG